LKVSGIVSTNHQFDYKKYFKEQAMKDSKEAIKLKQKTWA